MKMMFEINNKQAGLDEDEIQRTKRLLRFSLSRFEGVITRVKVRFFDVNGPKGGIGKHCRVSAKLRTTGQLIVSGVGVDYIEALNSCLQRLVRSVRRDTDKRLSTQVRKRRKVEAPFFDEN